MYRRHYSILAGLILLAVAFALLLNPSTPALAQDDTPAAAETEAPATEEATAQEQGFVAWLNTLLDENLSGVNGFVAQVLFFPVASGEVDHEGKSVQWALPFIVTWLAFGALFFTVWLGFINLRAFKHAVDVVRGRYDDEHDDGEVTHFQALTSALSATVGLGNIAGVAAAISLGGPGAVLWMTLAGFFGMSMKLAECTLGQMYRRVNPDGTISGGPMYYLERGLREMHPAMGILGKVLAVIFAFFAIGGSIGGGNMFQSNQAWESVRSTFEIENSAVYASIFGVVMFFMVGLVIIGGIRRIGAATSRIVPVMAGIYVLASIYILLVNFTEIPSAVGTIITTAFTDNALYGGIVGVFVMGLRRAAFSNEAGLGSAAIAHSAARTKEPVREGIVALLEPFIDTIVICNMTALVIVITGLYADTSGLQGLSLTKAAYGETLTWFPYVLMVCVVLFAYSTMISWCYYGERAWIYLLDHLGEGVGLSSVMVFRIIFLIFVYIGAVANFQSVIDFTDLLILSMAYPNILGCLILAPRIRRAVQDYWRRLKAGEMQPVR